jgi:hypothetical protein
MFCTGADVCLSVPSFANALSSIVNGLYPCNQSLLYKLTPLSKGVKVTEGLFTVVPKLFCAVAVKSKEVAEYIARYYECSLGEADHYIDILRENGVRDVLWKMGIDKKEQDKLVKAL